MSVNREDAKLSLKVMVNKEKNKLLFAVADNHFTDILLSFLTLPLGRVVKVLEKHYGDEAPSIGSLSTLYRSIASLDTAHFVTEGAKETLLDSRSSSEAKYEKLRIDISDSPPHEYFFCGNCTDRFRNVSVYVDRIPFCKYCGGTMSKEVVTKSSEAPPPSVDEVFTKHGSSFIISDDLQILPSETEFLRIIGILGITDTDNGKSIKVDIGFGEIIKLLKASLTSPTPLSDVILNKTTKINNPILKYQTKESCATISGKFILKVMIQNSTGKLLYAQAKKDFVEFLFTLLYIPLGGVEHLLGGKAACFKAIDNLYRSTSELIDEECFSTISTKYRLVKPTVVHGCISRDHILALTQELSSADFYSSSSQYFLESTVRFPKGKGTYLQGSRTYKVTDDLTVVPYCFVSILSSLREQKVLLSDVKEVEVKIGFEEALSILKASLTSTCALSLMLSSITSSRKNQRQKPVTDP